MHTPERPGQPTARPRSVHRILSTLATVAAFSFPLTAAEIDEFVGREVVSVTLWRDGRVLDDDAVHELVETRVGQPLSMRQVRESVTHLFSLGTFESVEVGGSLVNDGVVLDYALASLQVIHRIDVEGPTGLSSGALRRAIIEAHGPSLRIEDAPLVEGTLRRLYNGRGFLTADVGAEVATRGGRQVLRVTADAGPRAVIERVSVRGVSATLYSVVLQRLGISAGQPYDGVEVDRRLREYEAELRRQRYYEVAASHDIEVMTRGAEVHLVLDIRQGPQISVGFAGPPVPDADLAALVRIERERSVDEDLLEDAGQRIESLLQDRGYRDAMVTHARETNGDELSVVYTLQPGRLYEVEQVVFEGNAAAPSSSLGGFVSIGPGDPLVMRDVEDSVDRIAEYYRQLGYATVRVEPDVSEGSVPTNDSLPVPVSITIEIREGVLTTISSITIEGNEQHDDAALGASITSFVGGAYYARQVIADRDAIRRRYLNAGFERAVVSVEPRFSDELDGVDLIYRVAEGTQTIIEHVLIVGNARIASTTIRRELALEEGEPLGLAAVAETRRQLSELGLFRRIDIREFSHGGGGLRDVVVIVEEAPATRVGYGGGLEVSQRLRRDTDSELGISQAVERIEFAPRGFVQIGRRNLWGKNRSIDLFTRVSVRRQNDPLDPAAPDEGSGFGFNEYRILGTYTEPRAFGRVWDVFVTGFIEQAIRPGFDLFSRGVNAEAVRQVGSTLTLSAAYSWGENDTSNIQLNPEDVPIVDRLFEKVRLSSFTGAVVRDTRDDVVDPRRGALVSVDGKLAGRAIGSEVGFIKTFSQAFLYRTMPGTSRIVVAAGARLGLAAGFPQVSLVAPLPPPEMAGAPPSISVNLLRPLLPISERFFAGGDTTVRGFAFDRLGLPAGTPGATINEDGFPLGGNAVIIFNGELRLPVTRDIGVVGFLDAGNVYDRVSNIDLGRIRAGVGFGVRYRSPVGPIRVDLGFKLDRLELGTPPDVQKESLTALHISIGQAF